MKYDPYVPSPVAEVRHEQVTVDEYGDRWMMVDGVETKVGFKNPHALAKAQADLRAARQAALAIEREKADAENEALVGLESVRAHAVEWLEREGLLDDMIESYRARKRETRWQRLLRSVGTLKRSALSGVRSVLRIVGMGRTE